MTEAEKRERRALERKLSEMEEELKVSIDFSLIAPAPVPLRTAGSGSGSGRRIFRFLLLLLVANRHVSLLCSTDPPRRDSQAPAVV